VSEPIPEAGALAHGVIGPKRAIAFGMSNVAPAGAVVGGLVILVSCAGFASPLVIVVSFVASVCCASLLPGIALGWLGLGAIAAAFIRIRRPAQFETLGRVFMPDKTGHPGQGEESMARRQQDGPCPPLGRIGTGRQARLGARDEGCDD
jgi:hypothetical protein